MSALYKCIVQIPVFNIFRTPPHQEDIFEKREEWCIEPLRGKQFQPSGMEHVFTISSAIYQQEHGHYLVTLHEEEGDDLKMWEASPEDIETLLSLGFVRVHAKREDQRIHRSVNPEVVDAPSSRNGKSSRAFTGSKTK